MEEINLKKLINESLSIIYFKTDFYGNITFFNKGFDKNLDSSKNLKDILINPNFDKLIKRMRDGLFFKGIVTLQSKNSMLNSSYNSKIYKYSDNLIFVFEYDLSEFDKIYKELSLITLKLNNVNRELIKKEIELKKTIATLKETEEMLIHSEKMNALGQMIAGIAHEINNPLSYVTGNFEIIKEYFDSIKNFFKKNTTKNLNIEELNYIFEDEGIFLSTFKGLEKIRKIVSNLRNFSRIDESSKNFCNICDCLKSTIEMVKSEIDRKNIELITNFNDISNIECYPAELNQVFMNILINALQAVKECGKIVISVSEDDKNEYITIEDNGMGIPDNIKNRIFEPFFTTKPLGEGVGLGLSLSYKIIKDMHGGNILFESKEGLGTKFLIILPKKLR